MSEPTMDLITLFSLNPHKYTDQNLDAIIAQLRGMRHAFNAGAKSAGNLKPKTAKQKEADTVGKGVEIDL